MRILQRVDDARPAALRRPGSPGPAALLTIPAFAGVLGVLLMTHGLGGVGAFYAGLPLVIVMHEAAHACVGVAVGRRPRVMHLFGGRGWFTAKLGSTIVVVGRNVLGGGAMVSLPSPHRSWRYRDALMVLAGPASGAAVAVIAVLAVGDRSGVVPVLLLGIAGGGAWTAFASLVPHTMWSVTGNRTPSDGLLILRLLRGTDESAMRVERQGLAVEVHVQQVSGNVAAGAAMARHAAEASHDPGMARVAAVAALHDGQLDDARRFALDALGTATVWSRTELGELHGVVAWADLLTGDDASLDRAEHHARLARRLAPSAGTYDTWAWIALRRGRFVEAHEWFTEAFQASHPGYHSGRAVMAFGLAQTAQALGDRRLSDAWQRSALANARGCTVAVPPVVLPAVLPVDIAQGVWRRSRLDRRAVVGRGCPWWLWLTLAVCLVPVPLFCLADRRWLPFVFWSGVVATVFVAAERGRRRGVQTEA